MNTPATILQFNQPETYETDETHIISNDSSLRAVFGEELADVRPVVVSFVGNPSEVSGNAWFGHPWESDPNHITVLGGRVRNQD